VFRIREEQMQVFRDGALAEFKREMLEHFRVFAPELDEIVGDEGFEPFIDLGVEKARGHGLTLRGPVRFFLEVMCILGHHFDRDPQYRALWPENDVDESGQMEFARALFRRFRDFHRQCVGEDQVVLSAAIKAILGVPLPTHGAEDYASGTLRRCYPQKYDYIGEQNLSDLIANSRDVAESLELISAQGLALVIVLALCFGHGCLENPLYPWIAKRLSADAPEEDRVDKTFSALRTYGSQALANFQGRS
jgi:hypothetical protein